jgi:hypothetical protein
LNIYVASQYLESIHRLALGLELIDPIRERGLMHPVRVDIENQLPHPSKEPKDPYCLPQSAGQVPGSMCRHHSGRYALLYYPGIGTDVVLRIYDHSRYYVPRRLQVPLLTTAEIEQPENSHFQLRARRPVLFPGAAYDISRRATGLRGRVLRDDEPMRWAVINANLPGNNALIGRARSDDRGEFLLILAPTAAPASDITRTIEVRVSVSGPAAKPVPDSPDLPGQDDLWDLPLEILPAPGLADNVSAGHTLPAGYAASPSATRIVAFHLGRFITGIDEEPFEFSLP